MNTEETAFMYDSAGDVKRENRAISKFFEDLEEEGFTVQQVKNIVSRIILTKIKGGEYRSTQ